MSWFAADAPWFAFVIHPRDVPDLLAMPGASLVRDPAETDIEFVARAGRSPPMLVCDVVLTGQAAHGELIGIGRLPEAMLTPDGHRAVAAAVALAAHRGAPVVGLGALTAPATAGGRALLQHLPRGVTLTNGNGFTAAVVRENVHEACAWSGASDPRVALLGATGSVGSALAQLLAEDGLEPILVGTSVARVERLLASALALGATAAEGLDALVDADVVVLLTSDRSAVMSPQLVRPGAVVIDVAQPPNVRDTERAAFAARETPVVRGGIVRIAGYACRQDFALPSPSDTFACLAETYLLGCSGLREHAVGQPTADYARELSRLAQRHGVTVRPLALGKRQPASLPIKSAVAAAP
jgi:predicted amino acid dehydrogenase